MGDELWRVLSEEAPAPSLRWLQNWGVLALLDNCLLYTPAKAEIFSRIKKIFVRGPLAGQPAERALVYLLALLDGSKTERAGKLLRGMNYSRERAETVRQGLARRSEIIARLEDPARIKPSLVAVLMDRLPLAAVFYLIAGATERRVVRRLRDYVLRWRMVQTELTGKELKKLGLTPGPLYGRILKELRGKKLDGELKSKREELEYARERYVKK